MAVDWSIVHLERNTVDDGVVVAHWDVGESETVSGVTHSGQVYGAASFSPNPSDSGFVLFEALTEETVISWVKAYLGVGDVAAAEASVAKQLADSKAFAKSSGVPW